MKPHAFKDKDYPVPQMTEEERLAKGRQMARRMEHFFGLKPKAEAAQPTSSGAPRLPIQPGTDSVN